MERRGATTAWRLLYGGNSRRFERISAVCGKITGQVRLAPGTTVIDRPRAVFNFLAARQGSSAVEQGTHKPLVGSSILPPGTFNCGLRIADRLMRLAPVNDQNVIEKFFAFGNSYWLTRFIILRLLGFVYAVAFLVAANQLVPLLGAHGLTPATHFLATVQGQLGSRTAGMMNVPTLYWFGISDYGLSIFAWVGLALSLVVLVGYANAILLAILWIMYMSIVHIGQIWYGYGWEIQLLETGFLSIFLCPLIDGRPFPKSRPSILVIWLFRWLGFRIMIGAGLIKLRGDPCWRDLTCLYYHYKTQPIPNPISRYLHLRRIGC